MNSSTILLNQYSIFTIRSPFPLSLFPYRAFPLPSSFISLLPSLHAPSPIPSPFPLSPFLLFLLLLTPSLLFLTLPFPYLLFSSLPFDAPLYCSSLSVAQ